MATLTNEDHLLGRLRKYFLHENDDQVNEGWGLLPQLCVVAAIAILLVSLSYVLSSNGAEGAVPLFWASLILLFTPIALRFITCEVTRREGIGLIILLGITSYLINYLRNPLIFTPYDEIIHWRSAFDILQNRHLFTANALLPIAPFYPGLEIVTTALVSLSGLDIFGAGVVVLLIMRLVMMLGLYFLYEQLGHSERLAGIASLIYMGSSTFMFFDSVFAYESLALPLAVLAINLLLRRNLNGRKLILAWDGVTLLILFSVVSSHHATSYLLTFFLLGWMMLTLFCNSQKEKILPLLGMSLWMILLVVFWNVFVTNISIQYLGPRIIDAFNASSSFFTSGFGQRTLFQSLSGEISPWGERVVGIASAGLLTLGLMLGLWQFLRRYRWQATLAALALLASIYPLMLILRLTSIAWEVSNRLAGFIFIGLGMLVALGIGRLLLSERLKSFRSGMLAVCLLIILLGGIIAGSKPQTRLPAPYRAATDELSVDYEAIMSSVWARNELGANNRMVADRQYTVLIGAYGNQRMITNIADNVSVSGLFLKRRLDASDCELISRAQIHYLLVDKRISTALPVVGFYFESWEQQIVKFTPPVSLEPLLKFNDMPGVSLLYNSGDVLIYDIGGAELGDCAA